MNKPRWSILAVASLAFLATAQGAAATPAAPAPQATPATALPALPKPEADWARLRAKGTQAMLDSAHEALQSMYADGELAADCADRLPAVDAVLRQVPVAVAIWQVGADCARGGGDAARAEHFDEAVTLLAAHALARDSMAPGASPIPVLNADDISTIVDATGMKQRYRYVDLARFGHYYPVVVAVWDEERKLERHLAFDFLGALASVDTGKDWGRYPGYRAQLREAFIDSQSKQDNLVARDIMALRGAAGQTGEPALAALRGAAVDGGLAAVSRWLALCDGQPKACGQGAVDALLPYAEADLALHRVSLAMAQARGIGTERDLAGAMVMLDAAEKRLPGRAVSYFAELWSGIDGGHDLPRPALERLQRAATAGNRDAQASLLRIALRARAEDEQKLTPEALALAEGLAGAGSGDAAFLLYLHYDAVGDAARASEWLRRGAEGGHANDMLAWGYRLIEGKDVARDVGAGVDWLLRAASAGSTMAMEFAGHRAERGGHWTEAEHWFDSCILYHDEDCLLASAELHAVPHPGIEFVADKSSRLFDILHQNYDTPEVRRAHAAYLLKGAKPDAARARALLEVDAKAGDAQSQALLATYLMRGKLGPVDQKAGEQWMKKAMATDQDAGDAYAHYLYYRVRTPQARAKAVAIEQDMMAKGSKPAANNVAWWLCVNPDDAQRKPREGMAATTGFDPPERLDWAQLDTLAACHAANGEFERAAELQARVVREAGDFVVEADSAKRLQARLDAYRRHQPYLELQADEDPEE
jgi:TPR repeat protein